MFAPVTSALWPVAVGLVFGTGGTAAIAAYAWTTSDRDETVRAFTVLLGLVSVWTAGTTLRLFTASLQWKVVWHGVAYLGVAFVPVAWVVFALLYTGRTQYVRKTTLGGLLSVPTVTLTALYTNGWHGRFYADVGLSYVGETPVFDASSGILWWTNFVYSYFLVIAGIALFVSFALSAETTYRGQTAALLFGSFVPLVANLVTVFEFPVDPVVDLTPLAFGCSSFLLGVAVFYNRFLDIVPVAQDTVVQNLEDGVLVVDESGRVVSANPAAATIVSDGDVDGLLGERLSAVEPTLDAPLASAQFSSPGDGFEVSRVVDGDLEWFWVRKTDLTGATTDHGSVVTLTNISEKKYFERQLRKLHDTHQRLVAAETKEEIASIAVEAARDVLDLPFTGIWRHDDREDVLEPVEMTAQAYQIVDEQPTLEPGSSLAWSAFTEGELQIYDDLAEETSVHNPDTPLASEMLVPIGDWGLLITGSTTPREFRNTDPSLLRLLARAVANALQKTERERNLRRQNDRLKEFTDVVSHDLRSPLNQASIYLEMATQNHDAPEIDSALEATERAERMTEDLLRLARQGKTVEEPEPAPLLETVERSWESVQTGAVELGIDGDLGIVSADHARLREVFENLFRNAAEHGAATVEVGLLDDRTGLYVADDGPGIPEDVREDAFEHGYTHNSSGTGFGLAIVERIVDAHGWQVRATESTNGGARFEITDISSLEPAENSVEL